MADKQTISPTNKNHSSPWYSNDLNTWYTLFENAPIKKIRKNTVIIHENEQPQAVYLILEGRVRASMADEQGTEKTLLIYTEGTIIGEVATLEKQPSLITATSNTACTIAYMHHDDFLSKVMKDLQLSQCLAQSFTKKINTLIHHIKDISFMDANERVIAYLLKLVDAFGQKTEKGMKISIRFTHQEMADLVGTSRVTVSKTMSILEKGGIMQKESGYHYIKDTDSLKQWMLKNNTR
jgi:CRP/FNR family transcriptional regulator, cyclic AMP receptor protein